MLRGPGETGPESKPHKNISPAKSPEKRNTIAGTGETSIAPEAGGILRAGDTDKPMITSPYKLAASSQIADR